MLKYKILNELGFDEIKEGYYAKKIGEILVILEKIGSEMQFTSYCASTKIESDYELDSFLKKTIAGTGCKQASYANKKLELRFYFGTEDMALENIRTALDVIEKTYQEFDLLSACMKCGRIANVKLYVDDEIIQFKCDVCSSEDALRKKHEKNIADSRSKPEVPLKQSDVYYMKNAASAAAKGGFYAGLAGGIIALVMSMIGLILPVFNMMMWIPGIIAGYITIHKVVTIDCMSSSFRYLIATLCALVTIFACSFVGMEIVLFLSTGGSVMMINLGDFFKSFVGIMQIVLGLGGFFAAELFTFFTGLGE
ncbi:MAG: hypothetical protein IJ192_08435 [Clostridia bacterium]|nr:hypothetical protein [Clostridia bacterium]